MLNNLTGIKHEDEGLLLDTSDFLAPPFMPNPQAANLVAFDSIESFGINKGLNKADLIEKTNLVYPDLRKNSLNCAYRQSFGFTNFDEKEKGNNLVSLDQSLKHPFD